MMTNSISLHSAITTLGISDDQLETTVGNCEDTLNSEFKGLLDSTKPEYVQNEKIRGMLSRILNRNSHITVLSSHKRAMLEAAGVDVNKLRALLRLREAHERYLHDKLGYNQQLEYEQRMEEAREAMSRLDDDAQKARRSAMDNHQSGRAKLKEAGIYSLEDKQNIFVLYDNGNIKVRIIEWDKKSFDKLFTEVFQAGSRVRISDWSSRKPDEQRMALESAIRHGVDIIDSEIYRWGYRASNPPEENLAVLTRIEAEIASGKKVMPNWLNDKMLNNLRRISLSRVPKAEQGLVETRALASQLDDARAVMSQVASTLINQHGFSDHQIWQVVEKTAPGETVRGWLSDHNEEGYKTLCARIREVYKANAANKEELIKNILVESGFANDEATSNLSKTLADEQQGMFDATRQTLTDTLLQACVQQRRLDEQGLNRCNQRIQGLLSVDGRASLEIIDRLSNAPTDTQRELVAIKDSIDDLHADVERVAKRMLSVDQPELQSKLLEMRVGLPDQNTWETDKIDTDLLNSAFQIKLEGEAKATVSSALQRLNSWMTEESADKDKIQELVVKTSAPDTAVLTMQDYQRFVKIAAATEHKQDKTQYSKSASYLQAVEACEHALNLVDNATHPLKLGYAVKWLNGTEGLKLNGKDLKQTGFSIGGNSRDKLLIALDELTTLAQEGTSKEVIAGVKQQLQTTNAMSTLKLTDYQQLTEIMDKVELTEEHRMAIQACENCVVLDTDHAPILINDETLLASAKPLFELGSLEDAQKLQEEAQGDLKDHFTFELKSEQIGHLKELVANLRDIDNHRPYGEQPHWAEDLKSLQSILDKSSTSNSLQMSAKDLSTLQKVSSSASAELGSAAAVVAPEVVACVVLSEKLESKLSQYSSQMQQEDIPNMNGLKFDDLSGQNSEQPVPVAPVFGH